MKAHVAAAARARRCASRGGIRVPNADVHGRLSEADPGAMATGPARSMGDSTKFLQLDAEGERQVTTGLRGISKMLHDIQETIPSSWWEVSQGGLVTWMRAFTRLRVLIAMRGCIEDTTLFFEVGEGGQSQWI